MTRVVVCLLGLVILTGCEEEKRTVGKPPGKYELVEPPPVPPLPPPPPKLPYPRGGRVELADGEKGLIENKDTQRVKAEVGVGKKGRRLENKQLVKSIVTPARALFRTQQRLVFEVQIPSALKMYEGSTGRKPKTHEEFMEKVIKANKIKLPELVAGEKYVYDPKTGELMVERPAR